MVLDGIILDGMVLGELDGIVSNGKVKLLNQMIQLVKQFTEISLNKNTLTPLTKGKGACGDLLS
ncbi:MAG: hypothetical protein ACK5QS_06400 [Pseudanabaenaceae cyanobacterium]|jgi:hypothetical protein